MSGGRYMTVAQCAQQMLEIEAEKKEGGIYSLLFLPTIFTNAPAV